MLGSVQPCDNEQSDEDTLEEDEVTFGPGWPLFCCFRYSPNQ
jgi:hypothetical protein